MKTHKIIEIQGKRNYYCRIDSNNRIICVDPHNDYLYLKTLREVFVKHSKKVKFSLYDHGIDPDLYIAEDKYLSMLKKNPCLELLSETFETEIVS